MLTSIFARYLYSTATRCGQQRRAFFYNLLVTRAVRLRVVLLAKRCIKSGMTISDNVSFYRYPSSPASFEKMSRV